MDSTTEAGMRKCLVAQELTYGRKTLEIALGYC